MLMVLLLLLIKKGDPQGEAACAGHTAVVRRVGLQAPALFCSPSRLLIPDLKAEGWGSHGDSVVSALP